MKVLDKYLSRILLHGFVSSLGIIAGLLVLQRLYRIIDLAVARSLDGFQTLNLLLWALPLVFFYSLPISAIVGTLLTFGKLSADSELNAAQAAGISRPRMALIPFIFAIIISAAALWNNMLLMPHGYVVFDNVGFGVGIDPMKALRPGIVERISGRHLLLRTINHDDKTFQKLFAVVPGTDAGYTAGKFILVAETGKWRVTDDAIEMELGNGEIRGLGGSGGDRIHNATFGTYTLAIPLPRARSTEAKRLKPHELFGDPRPDVNKTNMLEFARRLLEAFSVPLLLFCAIPLAMPHGAAAARGTGAKGVVWLTFLLYFVYWLMAFLSESVVVRNSLPLIFLATPHFTLAVVGTFLWWKRA